MKTVGFTEIGLTRKDIHEARLIRDAAQERGEVQKQGGDGSSKAELPTAADIGLSHKDIHERRFQQQ